MTPMVQKLVSDAFLVNIGQLDHYIVFGTKSGGIQDFQRGKMCPIGVKQTPPSRPGNSVYFGSPVPSQKKSRSQKKGKEERRGERERIEKRGEEESKWGMKEKREIKGKEIKGGASYTKQNQEMLEPKKIRKRKGKEERKYWSQKKTRELGCERSRGVYIS